LFLAAIVDCTNPGICIAEITNTPKLFTGMLDSDCHVIVFGTFHAASGDIEGRLCVENNAVIGDFSIGLTIRTVGNGSVDNPTNYSLVVGGDLSWNSGSLYPDGKGNQPEENMFVGGKVQAPNYLKQRWTGGPCETPNCLSPYFASAQTYYETISSRFAAYPTNANIQLQYGSILVVTGNDLTSSRYYIHIDAAIFNQVTNYIVNANMDAEFIITITGTADVYFQGGPFPAPARHVLFNIPGSRSFFPNTGVMGSILAPNSTYIQNNGVITGYVICENIKDLVQINKLSCFGGCVCENY